MTKDDIQFIKDHTEEFDHVLIHNQVANLSTDIGKRVNIIHTQITGDPIENCGGCIIAGYKTVWDKYTELTSDKNHGKKETATGKDGDKA